MSQRDNFAGGFFAGAIFGGIVGGIVGAALASRRSGMGGENRLRNGKGVSLDSEEGMEMARRALEDRIAQLNLAIDDVRHQLGEVDERNRERESS